MPSRRGQLGIFAQDVQKLFLVGVRGFRVQGV